MFGLFKDVVLLFKFGLIDGLFVAVGLFVINVGFGRIVGFGVVLVDGLL